MFAEYVREQTVSYEQTLARNKRVAAINKGLLDAGFAPTETLWSEHPPMSYADWMESYLAPDPVVYVSTVKRGKL